MDEGHCKDWVRLDVGALVQIKRPLLPNLIYLNYGLMIRNEPVNANKLFFAMVKVDIL
jgi:hypothetical protein